MNLPKYVIRALREINNNNNTIIKRKLEIILRWIKFLGKANTGDSPQVRIQGPYSLIDTIIRY